MHIFYNSVDPKTVGLISYAAEALPALAGLIVFYKAEYKYKLMAIFLLYGFLSDVARWQLYEHNEVLIRHTLFYIYVLIESVFFCWFIYKTCDYEPVRETVFIVLFILPVAWALCFFDFTWLTWKINTSEAMFNTVYKMIVTVLTAYSILRLTQKKEQLTNLPDFWFLTAIFFYCITTFFVEAFLQTPQMEQFWFIHDLFNIMTMFIYAFGFFKIETKKVS